MSNWNPSSFSPEKLEESFPLHRCAVFVFAAVTTCSIDWRLVFADTKRNGSRRVIKRHRYVRRKLSDSLTHGHSSSAECCQLNGCASTVLVKFTEPNFGSQSVGASARASCSIFHYESACSPANAEQPSCYFCRRQDSGSRLENFTGDRSIDIAL